MPEPNGVFPGVADGDDDIVRVDAELVGGDLRQHRLVALTAGRVALEHERLAVRVEPHRRRAIARLVLHGDQHLGGDARGFDADAETDSQVSAAGARRSLLLAKALQIDLLHEVLEGLGEIAAVVVHAGADDVGEAAHEVAAPHLRRLHPERARNQVDAPLHHEAGGEAAEGACRRERGLVGHGHPDADVAGRQVVRVGQIGGAGERHDVAPVDAGAAVAGVPERAVAHRRDPPVGGGGDLDVVGLVALLAHGHEVLLARLDPAHRAGEHPRHVADQRRLPIEGRLDAERAALIARRNDANPVGRDVGADPPAPGGRCADAGS